MPPTQNKLPRPDLTWEYKLRETGLLHIAGLDEAGRGAWAGPVIAAAVILPLTHFNLASLLIDIRDSKLMTPKNRAESYTQIREIAVSVGLGKASPEEVDRFGIIASTRHAMHRAISSLSIPPQHLLIDHLELPDVEIDQTALSKGDRDVLSIAAASVIAKVERDEIMKSLDNQYPGYGFSRHKGYGTHEHRKCLGKLGVSAIHRKSFAPVATQLALAS